MPPSVLELFHLTHSRVRVADIVDFCRGDPSYPDYVRVWTEIHQTRTLPPKLHFDVTEVLGITPLSHRSGDDTDSSRFRLFRNFVSAVGLGLLYQGHTSEDVRWANGLACSLLLNLDGSDKELHELLKTVFLVTREHLMAFDEFEYPFLTLASMLLAQSEGDWEAAETLAGQLIDDECRARNLACGPYGMASGSFLFGIPSLLAGKEWWTLIDTLQNPRGDECTRLVIDALQSGVPG